MRTAFVCLLAVMAVGASMRPMSYQPKQTYVYRLDTQVASGLIGGQDQQTVQQRAGTRLRADVHVMFMSERQVQMQLKNAAIAEMNAELPQGAQRMQPFERFHTRQLPQQVAEQLELPLTFHYIDGSIHKIQFHESDSAWSKNIKRAGLHLMQLNLKRNDVQGLKMEPLPETFDKNAAIFSIPEITIDGECEVTYSVQKPLAERKGEFNVTKSVNFNRCQKTADMTYGYSTKPAQQLRCLNCLRAQQPQMEQVEETKYAQCQQECRPLRINEDEDIERSSVARYELIGEPNKFAIKRASAFAQYLVKGQSQSTDNSVAQIVAIAELTFIEQREGQKPENFKKSSQHETLMFSPEWDLKEKRFYMYGDEEFEKNSPFAKVEKKEQQALHAMRSIIKSWNEDKEQAYELDSALQFNELVNVMRQCSVKELKKIEKEVRENARQHGDKAEEQCKSIFESALAVAATRNTLFLLTEKIIKKECTPLKAVESLKIFLLNQHSPSERQADLIEKVCKSEVAQQHSALHQACWLSFGATIGEICQDKAMHTQKDYFRANELCPSGKKEQYKKTMVEQLKKAKTIYEKILALKTIGNAGLDITINELQKIVLNKQEPSLIRMEAIDAMRRLRTQIPQTIQQILLPIFQNQREQPELRMMSVSMIMYTHPEKAILDQLVFSTLNERSQNVKSFVLTCMNALAVSPNVAEQEIAQHMKAALKAVQVDGEQLRSSRFYRVPIYVSGAESIEEQNLFIGLASIFSPANMLPIRLATTFNSVMNGKPLEENLKLSFVQKDLEQWYEKIADFYNKYTESVESSEDNQERQSAKHLRAMYSSLGIKSRRTGSYYASSEETESNDDNKSVEQPFGMIVVRTNEVDKLIVPFEEHSLPALAKKIVRGEKPSLAGVEQWTRSLMEGNKFQYHAAANLLEKKTKLPTCAGLPLTINWQLSSVGSVEGQLKAQLNGAKKAELRLRVAGIATHVLKTECWTPVFAHGIETLRTVEWNTPVELEAELTKKGELQIVYRPPQQQSYRIFGVHTLPLTYTRDFDLKTRTYRVPRVVSVRNHGLEHTQRDIYTPAQKAFRAEGHVHWLKNTEQMVQALYTTENNLHVYYKPTEHVPKELIVRLSGSAFERLAKHQRPELKNFYSKKFETEDYSDMSLENDEQRRTKLDNFVGKFEPQTVYKHQLRVECEARCADKTHTLEAVVGAECDAYMKHCRAELNAVRSPLRGESSQWKLNAKLQTITPEIVRDEEEIAEKQSRAIAQLECQWGAEEQQKMNIRVQAEPTKKSASWIQSTWDKSESVETETVEETMNKPWSRFLNKIDLIAEYELKPEAKQYLKRVFEVVKAKFFWSLRAEEHRERAEENMVRATMIVDPLSRQFANISVHTPTEKLRFESIRLPLTMPAYRLDRRSASIHGLRHIVQRLSPMSSNAACSVSERRISTFDGVDYKAPISSCWTVLAKDCARSQPRFAVLMKQTSEEKKIKILTPEHIIELQTCDEKMCVKINGERVHKIESLQAAGIELESRRVYVNTRSIQVRFDGEECKINVSPVYKNTQCGLCGHYSDEEENVFRMSNNKRSNNLKEFHQSYTLKNEECSEQEYNKFYNERESREFRVESREQETRRYRNPEEQTGFLFESNESESRQESEENTYEKNEKIQPMERTAVREYQHKICFSIKPVKRCPTKTQPIEETLKMQKIEFACVNRSSVESRRLLRKVREGRLADMTGFTSSYVESVQQPTQCVYAY